MTPERAKELLPIITAYANGKVLQHCFSSSPTKWSDINFEPSFTEECKYYRVKPEYKQYYARRYLYNDLIYVARSKEVLQDMRCFNAGSVIWLDPEDTYCTVPPEAQT